MEKNFRFSKKPYMKLEQGYYGDESGKLKIYADRAVFYEGEEYWIPMGIVFIIAGIFFASLTVLVTNLFSNNALTGIITAFFMILFTMYAAHQLLCIHESDYIEYESGRLSNEDGQALLASILSQKSNITDGEKIYLNSKDMKLINNYCGVLKNEENKNIIDEHSMKLDKHLEKYNLTREGPSKGRPSIELIEESRKQAKGRVDRDSVIKHFNGYLSDENVEALFKASKNYDNLSVRGKHNFNEILSTFVVNVKRCGDAAGTEEFDGVRENLDSIVSSVMGTVREYGRVTDKTLVDSSKVDAIYIMDKYGK